MSRVTANIPKGTQEYFSNTSAQLLNRQKLRGVTVVFGIGEERPFYVEKAPSLLLARLKHNTQFFLLNYILVSFVMFCLTVLTRPFTIIGLGLLGALWVYVVRQTSSGAMQVYGMSCRYDASEIHCGNRFGSWIFLFVVPFLFFVCQESSFHRKTRLSAWASLPFLH